MTETTPQFEVRDRTEESRYVLIDKDTTEHDPVIGQEAYVDVDSDDGIQRVLYHTEVSPAYGGQGLGSFLVKAVVEDTIARGYAVVPVCPYVAKWLPRHPAYAAHVVQPTPAHLRAVEARKP